MKDETIFTLERGSKIYGMSIWTGNKDLSTGSKRMNAKPCSRTG
jgi:hypothetical protein